MGRNRNGNSAGKNGKRSISIRTALRIAIILILYSTTPSKPVDADQLVWRAMRAERAPHATVLDRASVRFLPHGGGEPISFAYEPGFIEKRVPDRVPLAVAEKLRALGFDWSQPLGMQLPNAFRVAHALDKTEHLVRRTSAGLLILTTAAPEQIGELSEIELTVNDEAFHVVHLTLVFRDIGRLEIGELTRRIAGYIPPRKPAPIISIATTTSAPRPSRDELDLAELNVRLLFARTGLDVRGGIRISRTSDAVRVEGRQLSADELSAIKYVEVRPAEGPSAAGAAAGAGAAASVGALSVPAAAEYGLRDWRDRTFHDSPDHATFLRKLTRSLATVRQRLAILTELSDLSHRYAAASNSEMSPAARRRFEDLVDLQYQRLRATLNDSRVHMQVLAGGEMLANDAQIAPRDLVTDASTALARATDLQHLVLGLLSQDDLSEDDQRQARAAFTALWESVHGPNLSRR
jgi:hypothetical protein